MEHQKEFGFMKKEKSRPVPKMIKENHAFVGYNPGTEYAKKQKATAKKIAKLAIENGDAFILFFKRGDREVNVVAQISSHDMLMFYPTMKETSTEMMTNILEAIRNNKK